MSSTWTGNASAETPAASSDEVAELVAAHGRFVFMTLQRFGVRGPDVEDLAQEVFVVAFQRLHSRDPAHRVTTWLWGVCMRVASNHRRRAWVRRERPHDETPEPAEETRSPDAEEVAHRRQQRAQLDAILDELDLERRATFVMFEIDGMTCDEIAADMGVPVGTVYSRLHAARKQFQEALRRARLREGGRR
ncbi:MAG: sigma-70 family RNA polymerase sigma factor [Polyangiales bacterium]